MTDRVDATNIAGGVGPEAGLIVGSWNILPPGSLTEAERRQPVGELAAGHGTMARLVAAGDAAEVALGDVVESFVHPPRRRAMSGAAIAIVLFRSTAMGLRGTVGAITDAIRATKK